MPGIRDAQVAKQSPWRKKKMLTPTRKPRLEGDDRRSSALVMEWGIDIGTKAAKIQDTLRSFLLVLSFPVPLPGAVIRFDLQCRNLRWSQKRIAKPNQHD
jgi:hypothetical protein